MNRLLATFRQVTLTRSDKRFPGSLDAPRNCLEIYREREGEGYRDGRGIRLEGGGGTLPAPAPFERHPLSHFTISINIKPPSPNEPVPLVNRRTLRSFAALNAPGIFVATHVPCAEILSNARVPSYARRDTARHTVQLSASSPAAFVKLRRERAPIVRRDADTGGGRANGGPRGVDQLSSNFRTSEDQ